MGTGSAFEFSYCIAVLDPGTHQTIINNAVIIFNVFSATQPAANRIGMRLRIPAYLGRPEVFFCGCHTLSGSRCSGVA